MFWTSRRDQIEIRLESLSPKTFSCWLVKDILTKAWNLINEVEVNVVVVDKTTFMFVFKHEADVRSAWEQGLGQY